VSLEEAEDSELLQEAQEGHGLLQVLASDKNHAAHGSLEAPTDPWKSNLFMTDCAAFRRK